MKRTIYQEYSCEADMTFIMEDIENNNEIVSTEVKGFYFGKPTEAGKNDFYGKLKEEF